MKYYLRRKRYPICGKEVKYWGSSSGWRFLTFTYRCDNYDTLFKDVYKVDYIGKEISPYDESNWKLISVKGRKIEEEISYYKYLKETEVIK